MSRYIQRQWTGERGEGGHTRYWQHPRPAGYQQPNRSQQDRNITTILRPQPTEIALSAKRAKQKPRVVPAYKRASWDRIKAALNAIHQEILEKVRTASSIDSIWTLFRDKLCEAINEHIPIRTIKESMRLPWVTTRLRRLGRCRDRASKRARRNGHDPRLRVLAGQLKHDHQRAMRKA